MVLAARPTRHSRQLRRGAHRVRAWAGDDNGGVPARARTGAPENFAPLASLRWQVHVYGAAAPKLASTCASHELPLRVYSFGRAATRAGIVRNALYELPQVRELGREPSARRAAAATGRREGEWNPRSNSDISPVEIPAGMSRSFGIVAALLASCATVHPLHPADQAIAARGDPEIRETEAAGVKVAAKADVWHNWLSDVQSRVTPIEVVLRNDSGSELLICAELFVLVLPNGARLAAMTPAELHRALPDVAPPAAGLAMYPAPRFPGEFPGRQPMLYSWPGVQGRGPVRPPVTQIGPDTRPAPIGTLPTGRTVDLVVFFDTPADKLSSFVFETTLADADAQRLGVARVAFAR